MITEEDATDAVREFLSENPEHIQGSGVVGGQTVMDTAATLAFARWGVREGRLTQERCDLLTAKIREHYLSIGKPFPEEVRPDLSDKPKEGKK